MIFGFSALVVCTSGCRLDYEIKGYAIAGSDKTYTQTVQYGFVDDEVRHILIINDGGDDISVNINPPGIFRSTQIYLHSDDDVIRVDGTQRIYFYDGESLSIYELNPDLSARKLPGIEGDPYLMTEENIVDLLVKDK